MRLVPFADKAIDDGVGKVVAAKVAAPAIGSRTKRSRPWYGATRLTRRAGWPGCHDRLQNGTQRSAGPANLLRSTGSYPRRTQSQPRQFYRERQKLSTYRYQAGYWSTVTRKVSGQSRVALCLLRRLARHRWACAS